MNIDAHVETLSAKHAELDKSISAEEHRPAPNSMRLSSLKKQKLRLKEELRQFTKH